MQKFLLTALVKSLIEMAKGLVSSLPSDEINNTVQRPLTVDERVHDKLCSGFSVPERAEADELRRQWAEAGANYLVHMASRGTVDPDYSEFVKDEDVREAVEAFGPTSSKIVGIAEFTTEAPEGEEATIVVTTTEEGEGDPAATGEGEAPPAPPVEAPVDPPVE